MREDFHYRLIVLHQVLWLLCTRGLLKCKTKGVRFYIWLNNGKKGKKVRKTWRRRKKAPFSDWVLWFLEMLQKLVKFLEELLKWCIFFPTRIFTVGTFWIVLMMFFVIPSWKCFFLLSVAIPEAWVYTKKKMCFRIKPKRNKKLLN